MELKRTHKPFVSMLPFGTAQGMGLLDFIKEALKSETVLIQILPSIVTVN